ncbi:glycosyltransferase family 2 protein [Achromobacter agilis]|uniref:GalNAc(5)-diNAcBac-PP-undecaprenol beta-1,3-glucosyltransferase n=1 Tax=Achromobacter agilis TaxID=1353888 RepID=A0A446C2P9_9BURK|nr:glycosyltransferase family 2 protein [Achromobacter agilis]SSW62142.1 GalNAc(5)-diNAcBac-PP-undecaprenol beta-1,3-glucosyltransferase [Achromobacter agilis]
METLLSIAIPTHNRAKYAIHAIKSILAINSQKLELVVSDTSTDGELEALVRQGESAPCADPRLKYLRPTERLDMTGNHNNAIGAATGAFVCLIGDDDTITADLILAAEWAQANQIDVIAPTVMSNYVWPDFRSRHFGAGHAGRLYLPSRIGPVNYRQSPDSLTQALSNAAQGTDGLPKIYHGVVRRSVLEKAKQLTGAYFHGSSPDVSGAIGLALCTERFVEIDYPLTIPGASGGSNTGRSAMNQHKGKLGQEDQTKAFETAGWSDGVPRFFSVETVWAHAALETIVKIAPENLQRFNFARLIAVCEVLHKDYANEIAEAVPRAAGIVGMDEGAFLKKVAAERGQYRRQRLVKLLRRAMKPTVAGGREFKGGIDRVDLAPPVLEAHMQSRHWNWADAVNGRSK